MKLKKISAMVITAAMLAVNAGCGAKTTAETTAEAPQGGVSI